jgi:hypothetical protein
MQTHFLNWVWLRRPLKIVICDCKFLVDLAARNAIWGVIDHLVNAFVSPPAVQAANAAAAVSVPTRRPHCLPGPAVCMLLCWPGGRGARAACRSPALFAVE